jgi:hypothetical protein
LFKPDISATVCFLKYVGCMSLSGIKKYLYDVWGEKVTKGYLARVLQKGSLALEPCYDELLKALPFQQVVNGDETGHKENGKNFWTWVFRSNIFTLFKISPSRGSDVLIDVLGKEFDGVLGCDYFSAYRKYMRDCDVLVQFCMAHLIRDVKFLLTLPGREVLDRRKKLIHVLRGVAFEDGTEPRSRQLRHGRHVQVALQLGKGRQAPRILRHVRRVVADPLELQRNVVERQEVAQVAGYRLLGGDDGGDEVGRLASHLIHRSVAVDDRGGVLSVAAEAVKHHGHVRTLPVVQ